jgi:hypothetical protein
MPGAGLGQMKLAMRVHGSRPCMRAWGSWPPMHIRGLATIERGAGGAGRSDVLRWPSRAWLKERQPPVGLVAVGEAGWAAGSRKSARPRGEVGEGRQRSEAGPIRAGAGTGLGGRSRMGRASRESAQRPVALLYLLSSVSFDPWHLFLIREMWRARKLEDFAIPGVISPSLAPEPAWDSNNNRVAWRVPNSMLLM